MRNSGLLKWVPTGVNKNNKLTSNKDKDEKGKNHRLWSGSEVLVEISILVMQ